MGTELSPPMKGVIEMQLKKWQETWDPFRELDDLSTRMNRLFGLTRWDGELADWSPACDVSEDENGYRIRLELPGLRKEDVHVRMENGVLVIQGERKEEKEEKGVKYHRRELSYGKFVRRFTIPDAIDESKIEANFHDGILNLVLTRTKTAPAKTKEIPIN